MNEEKPKNNRIGAGEGALITLFALVFDLFSLIPFVNFIVVIIGQALLTFFFYLHGVSMFTKKKAVTVGTATVIEAIPFLSIIPALTAQTLIVIFMTRAEDKTGISIPTGVLPKK